MIRDPGKTSAGMMHAILVTRVQEGLIQMEIDTETGSQDNRLTVEPAFWEEITMVWLVGPSKSKDEWREDCCP